MMSTGWNEVILRISRGRVNYIREFCNTAKRISVIVSIPPFSPLVTILCKPHYPVSFTDTVSSSLFNQPQQRLLFLAHKDNEYQFNTLYLVCPLDISYYLKALHFLYCDLSFFSFIYLLGNDDKLFV